MPELIQIIGMRNLDDNQKPVVNKLVNEYYQKFFRTLKNEISLQVHIKKTDKGGKRKRYELRVRVNAPTRIFESKKALDWDLQRTLHKAFKDLESQFKHKLHTDDQHNKTYG